MVFVYSGGKNIPLPPVDREGHHSTPCTGFLHVVVFNLLDMGGTNESSETHPIRWGPATWRQERKHQKIYIYIQYRSKDNLIILRGLGLNI